MKNVIFVVLTTWVMISCTNKNVDDARNEEAAKVIAQYRSLEGTYGGSGSRNSDGSPMGDIQLLLRADIDSRERPDGISNEIHASLAGTITHLDTTQAQISFSSGTYDEKSGAIVISVPVGDKKIKILGVISGDKKTISTAIEAEGVDPKFGVKAILKKNAPPITPKTTNQDTEAMIYSGKLAFQNSPTEYKIIMSISTPIVDARIKFYNLLVPTKEVEVTLNIDGDLSVSTPKGYLDTYFHTLNALFESTSNSGERFLNKLLCGGLPDKEVRCALTHPRLGKSTGVFTRVQ
ncbi:MAG: hypothetical protein A4S09_06800 [Proteobacteria bacterium SG_bin7]|nr:MAG: hypothetical protein A4S09_06800 [Proteobacteria bacterium SG_bin7]